MPISPFKIHWLNQNNNKIKKKKRRLSLLYLASHIKESMRKKNSSLSSPFLNG